MIVDRDEGGKRASVRRRDTRSRSREASACCTVSRRTRSGGARAEDFAKGCVRRHGAHIDLILRSARRLHEYRTDRGRAYLGACLETSIRQESGCFPESYGAAPTPWDENSAWARLVPERLKPPLGLRQALSRADALCEQGFRSVNSSEVSIQGAPRRIICCTIACARPKDLLSASTGLNSRRRSGPYAAESRSFGRRQTPSQWMVRAAPPSGKQASARLLYRIRLYGVFILLS
jgi:hypothetical protein